MPANYKHYFCPTCQAGIIPIPPAHCQKCKLPFTATDNSSHLCGRCLKQAPIYNQVFCVGIYEQTLQRAIQQFKFNQKVGLDRSLSNLMVQNIAPNLTIDLIIPVPLHQQKLQDRSYNQALLLARQIASQIKVPVSHKHLLKLVDTKSQQGLSARKRIKNLQKAFSVAGDLKAKNILLVDDVMTTGATVNACCRALKEAGANSIHVAIIARAPI